jgi:hypothetical protein
MTEIDLQGQADRLRGQTEGGRKRFLLLSSPSWGIHYCCEVISALPVTDEEVRVKFALASGDQVSDFQDAVEIYKKALGLSQVWGTAVKPRNISVAADVSNYGRNVKIYYGEMLRLAEEGLGQGDNKKDFLDIVGDRSKKSRSCAGGAKEVSKAILAWSRDLSEGEGGVASLEKKYTEKYWSRNKKWMEVQAEVFKLQGDTMKMVEEYEKVCAAAGVKPVYYYIPLLALLAPATVASSLHGKVAKLKQEIKAIEKEIGDEKGVLTRNSHVLTSVRCAHLVTSDLRNRAERASGVPAKIGTGWEAIAGGLEDLSKLAESNVQLAESLVKGQTKKSIQSWEELAAEADAYIQQPPAAVAANAY